jgi:hypothetical protein
VLIIRKAQFTPLLGIVILSLPKARVPLGASHSDFPIHAGSLVPHLQPWVASATSTTATTVEPASTRRCTEATPSRGGCYYSEEDRSPSPEPPGPQAFSRAIRRASFPTRFRASTTIIKYLGETRPELWLADYRLACQLGGTDDDNIIIRNLPLFLSDAARAWLEHLPPA